MPVTAAAQVQVQLESEDGELRVALAGALDASAAGRVRAQLKRVLRQGVCSILFDLRRVTYVDRPGLDALVHAARVAHRLGGRVALSGCPDDLSRQLSALGHDRLFQMG